MKLCSTTGDFLYYDLTPAQAVRAFEGTGFKHLDYTLWREGWNDKKILQDNWKDRVIAAGKEAEKLGFDFVQAHSPGLNCMTNSEDEFEEIVLATTRSVEACGYLGIHKIVVHSGCSGKVHYPDGKDEYFRQNKIFFERLFPAMEKYNVKVLIENGFGSNKTGNYFFMKGQEMRDFIDFCGHPLLGACWDTGHGNIETDHPYDDMTALGDKLEAVHFQDNLGQVDNHLAPYMGILDIDGVMNALIDTGFDKRGCYLTFECDNILKLDNHHHDARFASIAEKPTLELKRAAIRFLYEVGKTVLSAYNLYEE